MDKVLQGKIAVVTGASSGIGRAIALKFGESGARVALLARRKDRLEKVCQAIEKSGGKALALPTDLLKPEQIQKTFAAVRKSWGDPQILVNNAGIGFSGPLQKFALEEYEHTFDLNVRAAFLCAKEVLPAMLKAKDGTIINIGSLAGRYGIGGSVVYCASKFAMVGFTDALLEEVRGSNVRVTMINPGMVETEFFKGRETGRNIKDAIRPEEVAEAALLCARDMRNATVKEIFIRPRRPLV